MSHVGELINALAIQSGISADDEGLKALLTNPQLSQITVPEAVESSIQSNLLTLESAKNNPKVKAHFTALAYNGLDAEIQNTMNTLGFDEATKAEILAEGSSTKRAALLSVKAKEIAEKQAADKYAESGKGKDELNRQIESLNGQINSMKEQHEQAIASKVAEHRGQLQDLSLRNLLSGYNYALPLSPEANVQTAMSLLQTELAAKGLKVGLSDNNELTLTTNEGTKYFPNNKEVGVKDFADEVLGKHKLLQAKGSPTPPAPTPPSTPPTPPGNGTHQTVVNSGFKEAASALAKQFDEK